MMTVLNQLIGYSIDFSVNLCGMWVGSSMCPKFLKDSGRFVFSLFRIASSRWRTSYCPLTIVHERPDFFFRPALIKFSLILNALSVSPADAKVFERRIVAATKFWFVTGSNLFILSNTVRDKRTLLLFRAPDSKATTKEDNCVDPVLSRKDQVEGKLTVHNKVWWMLRLVLLN